jgi:hypothetical protein
MEFHKLAGELGEAMTKAPEQDYAEKYEAARKQYESARGVAAPLEPTPLTAKEFWPEWNSMTYGQRVDQYEEFYGWQKVMFAFAEAYAAAVSKAKDDKIAELRARISELEKEVDSLKMLAHPMLKLKSEELRERTK